MNEQPAAPPHYTDLTKAGREAHDSESGRIFIFLGIQIGFLIASPFTGGFHNTMWSMLDSAILISSIGITGLLFVIDAPRARKIVFIVAIVLYVCAIIDMSVNVMLTGWLGWKDIGMGG